MTYCANDHQHSTSIEGNQVKLGIADFQYEDLYSYDRLKALAESFDDFVRTREEGLFSEFDTYRQSAQAGTEHGGVTSPEESRILIEVGRYLSQFLVKLFGIEGENEALRTRALRDAEVAAFKKDFVVKRVAKIATPALATEELASVEASALDALESVTGGALSRDRELALAHVVNKLIKLEKDYPRSASTLSPSTEGRAELRQILERLRGTAAGRGYFNPVLQPIEPFAREAGSPEMFQREAAALHGVLDLFVRWAAARRMAPSAEWNSHEWTSFRLPHTLHFDRLVNLEQGPASSGSPVPSVRGAESALRRRDGFGLTDPRFTPREITDEAHYCIYCHERKKDSCAHGFVEKDGSYKPNPLGLPLQGCPLDEKIGEMNELRAGGDSIGSLAMVIVDNPMCPGTGHRICNDCMRACIFQKQEPVNIPQIETGVLTDVLFLPYGFEIYSLLTRWNPLNARRPVARPFNGKKVLIVGLGPAGYTLAHHLACEGFGVAAIDALKIEPMDEAIVGSATRLPEPIADIRKLWDRLDERILAGFGGVSEYGITVRWDKNFLKCIRIAVERNRNIRIYGGIRFGGTLSIEDAFDRFGFDHIAIAAGAGTPTLVRMKNNLVRGIRKASDFLMALQLTGAFKKDSLANLQVCLPALVIGGGLTAVDTATELFAYYPLQVEKIAERYQILGNEIGEDRVRSGYDAEELQILDEFLMHGRVVKAERERATKAGEAPNFIPLIRSWGGVSIAYRKSINDSPAYRLNYEEVAKAMEEGIEYIDGISPVEALQDSFGHLRAVVFQKQTVEDGRWVDSGAVFEIPCRSVMVAAGTSPNVIYEKEHPGTFQLDKYGEFFQGHRLQIEGEDIRLVPVESVLEPPGFFTSYAHPKDPRKLISFYGDNHPTYAGNVVKAMASAKYGFRHVVQLFEDPLRGTIAANQGDRDQQWTELLKRLDDGFLAHVAEVNRLTSTIVEVVVHAPLAAEKFQPGQFYRLQNFETFAPKIGDSRLTMEGLALTGAWTDPAKGLLSLIILEMGGSSRLCAALKPGEPVVVMGPTGTPTEIPSNETILLAGGGLGNAVLFSIAKGFKKNGCEVIYFAGYKKAEDLFKKDEIEASTDQVIWSVDAGAPIHPGRPNDLGFVGNIIQSMMAYATGTIRDLPANTGFRGNLIPLDRVNRIIAIGSDGMMRAVKDSRHGVLQPFLSPSHIGIGSVNSPMQCMMKQVCAQCLQRHVDPVTGKESFVFSCFNQDQELDRVDFVHLRARLRQNTVLEKLTNLWLTKLLAQQPIAMV
ncbi:MAG TPA: FAD-dependent oxidoreductase [Thermoanaerobaculia bacterium]|nr:FAD-dependent oxidoreductase [Thermoanaerobaculia bacterium]